MKSAETQASPECVGELELAADMRRLGVALPKLFAALHSDDVRRHPVWSNLIPYAVPAYGEGPSLGHCVRPDIVVTEHGPRISEFDFVPSGRGFALDALGDSSLQRAFLEPFAAWYADMGANKVLYGTASHTTCWEESQLFSQRLAEEFGVDIRAVNLDMTDRFDGVIDRLSYRSEMETSHERRLRLAGAQVITAEPYLDSKMIFALVHATDMEQILLGHMSVDDLAALREMMPETYAVETASEELLEQVVNNKDDWVVKSTDIEVDCCWGSRGTIIGSKYTKTKFGKVVYGGEAPGNKDLGKHPVVQRLAESIDFAQTWNLVAHGAQRSADPAHFGKAEMETINDARKKVYARVGVYLLVSNVSGTVFMPPFAINTLRQDILVHGSSDSLITVARVV